MGRRAYRALVDLGRIKPPTYFVRHRARKGDTLGHLARRYGTTVRAIQKANGLRGTRILAKRTYKIPKEGGVRHAHKPVRIPARRLPPAAGTSARHKAAP
jgi:penicillin-insensitive murein endopeptidase